VDTWNHAEAELKAALDAFTESRDMSWEENPGDGAFYGPKIDVALTDALNREHQCGTIQLDFQLPQRFQLKYATAGNTKENVDPVSGELPNGYARPVMIHRALFGSFERFIAILTEHLDGKWPFWLSPRQILVLPVSSETHDYAIEVRNLFRAQGMYVDADLSGNTLQKRIRMGQIEQYNFIFGEFVNKKDSIARFANEVSVVGNQERDTCKVNVRNRNDQSRHPKTTMVPLQTVIDGLKALRDERRLANTIDYDVTTNSINK
jgi:threonyl-tRNA synthetase